MTHQEIAEKYAERVFQGICSIAISQNPEKYKQLPQERFDEVKAEHLRIGQELIATIQLKDVGLAKAIRIGTFTTANKASRILFEDLTGSKLPSGNNETRAWLIEYMGGRYEQIAQEKERVEQEKRDAQLKKEHDAHKEYVGRMCDKIRADEQVCGDDLAEVAKSLGIEVAPRTIGMLRKKIYSINSYTGKIAKGTSSLSAFALYKECQKILRGDPETKST